MKIKFCILLHILELGWGEEKEANYSPVLLFPKAKVGWTWLSGALGHQPVSMGAAWCNETWLAVGARGAGQGQQKRSCFRAGEGGHL